jgi:hypothetical protein
MPKVALVTHPVEPCRICVDRPLRYHGAAAGGPFWWLFMMVLSVASNGAAAAWIAIGVSEPSTLYADTATIQKNGDVVNMLDLLDFKTAQVSGDYRYQSSKTLSEYDCKEQKSRIRHFSWHSGHMGLGRIVHMELDSNEWLPVPPRSGVEKLWNIACGKQ